LIGFTYYLVQGKQMGTLSTAGIYMRKRERERERGEQETKRRGRERATNSSDSTLAKLLGVRGYVPTRTWG
jgi:hypothetical protein